MAQLDGAESSYSYFLYSAVVAALSDDLGNARELMTRAHANAAVYQVHAGLQSLAHFTDLYPSQSSELRYLAEIFQRGDLPLGEGDR
jgi:hypothetical protein